MNINLKMSSYQFSEYEKLCHIAYRMCDELDYIDEVEIFTDDGYEDILLAVVEYDDEEMCYLTQEFPNAITSELQNVPDRYYHSTIVDEYKESLLKEKQELEERLASLDKPRGYSMSMFLHSDDDDEYQECLEYSWEVRDIKDRLKEIEDELNA